MRTPVSKRAVTTRRTWAPQGLKVSVMLLLPLLVAMIVACDSTVPTATPPPAPTIAAVSEPAGGTSAAAYANVTEGKPKGLSAPIPDPKETLDIKSGGQLPDFLSQAPPTLKDKIAGYYTGAMQHYDAYNSVPCYCGCAIYTTAHKSLAECYIKDMTADGQVTFTDHSLTCDLCQTAARMTMEGVNSGKPLKDVRADIFKALKYTDIWTATPAIQ